MEWAGKYYVYVRVICWEILAGGYWLQAIQALGMENPLAVAAIDEALHDAS
jgi:hypothetical protein